MTVTSITLTDPVSGYSVPIMPNVPAVAAQSLEVEPSVRTVFESRVGAYGSVDTTVNLDAAVVTMQLLLFDPDGTGGPQAAFMDSLGPLLLPSARPALIVTDSEWSAPRQLTVRLDSMQKPRSDPTNWPVQIFWVAPNGVWEATTASNAVVNAFIGDDTGLTWTQTGITWTTAGITWPASDAPSPQQVTSPGSAPSQWTAFLYGPCVGPKLANDATGLTIEFADSLVLNAGEYVALDSLTRSANLQNAPSSSVLSDLIFTTSDWWTIAPGLNLLRFYPTSAGAGSVAQVTFSPAWMA